jgi:hypothetical protein
VVSARLLGALLLAAVVFPAAAAGAGSGPPIAVEDVWQTIWGQTTCVPLNVQANDRLGDDPVVRRIANAPLFARLYAYDPAAVGGYGPQISAGQDGPADLPLCYRTNSPFFSGSDTFTYTLNDPSTGAALTGIDLVKVSVGEADPPAPNPGDGPNATGVVASSGDGQATLTWDSGGPAVSLLFVFVDGTRVDTQTITPTGSSYVYGGLTNGLAYSFSVQRSHPSNVVVAGVRPGAPTALQAARNAAAVDLTWQAPALLGDPALTGYEVTVSVDGVARAPIVTPDSALSVPGLPDGAELRFAVTARSVVGDGPSSTAAVLPALRVLPVATVPPPWEPTPPDHSDGSATPEPETSPGGGLPAARAPAPVTRITSTRVGSATRSARFTFTASGDATGFRCGLARADATMTPALTACTSAHRTTRLRPGLYRFFVTAVGPGGVDPTPATHMFRIRTR